MVRKDCPVMMPVIIEAAVVLYCILVCSAASFASDGEKDKPLFFETKITSSPPRDARLANLTLRDCLDIALANNHSRAVSRLGIQIAEAQHRQATSAWWPQVGIKAAYSVMDEDPNFIFPAKTMSMPASTIVATTPLGPISIQVPASSYEIPEQNVKLMDRKNFHATLNAILPLYTGGRIDAVARQSEQGIRAAREEARRTDLQLNYDVTRYYFGAVLAEELLRIGREALSRMELTLELTGNLYTKGSGKVKKTDYLRNKTVVEGLRSAVAALEGNEQLAKAALTNTMGIAWDTPIKLAHGGLPFAPVQAGLPDLVAGVYHFNPDWARLEAGLKAAEAKIDEARSGHLPSIGLFGTLSRIENSYDKGIVTPQNRNSWMVGIGIELPLFNGMRTVGEVREAKARFESLKEKQILLKEGLALQVKHIFIKMMSSQAQKASSESAAISSQENRELNERAYMEELVETKDVIEAQLVESLMKAQYQKALYDHIEARANLEFVVGKEITDLMKSIH
ncbi:MAG: TolC family protein [Geobacteraceae bacterium]|nr:TolC family protein [Geobacteraceae bacterium]